MEQSEHRRTQDLAETGAWLIYETGEADREVLQQWLAIPNEPDCHPYVMGLQHRFGADRVHRVSELVAAARRRTGLHYSEFKAAMLSEIAKPGVLYLSTGLSRASFGALKIVEFPPVGSGRPIVVDERMTGADALAVACEAQWPNVRRIYTDRGEEAASFTPPAP